MEGTNIALLDGLAREAQVLARNTVSNLISLGRVFTEAKAMIPHGEWEDWVRSNTGMSMRMAQNAMKTWRKFGGMDMDGIAASKVITMLALPDGSEAEFIDQHNLSDMSRSEVFEAVKAEREKANAEIARIRGENAKAMEDAQSRLKAAEREQLSMRQEMERIREEKASSSNHAEMEKARSRIQELEGDITLQRALMQEQQAEYDAMQKKLNLMEREAAKGDAEREVTEEITAEEYAGACRQFLGQVFTMPHMRRFSRMEQEELERYREATESIESWLKGVKRAMNTVESVVIEHV